MMGKTRRRRPWPGVVPNGYCPEHDKIVYPTRAAARQFLRRTFPGEQMNVYRCGDGWHCGHLLPAAKRGLATRDGMKWLNS